MPFLPPDSAAGPERPVPSDIGIEIARVRAEEFARHDMWLSPMSDHSWVVRTLHPAGDESGLIGNIDERSGQFELTTLTGEGGWNRFESMSDAVAHLVRVRAPYSTGPEVVLGR
jgi:hypothetical protein